MKQVFSFLCSILCLLLCISSPLTGQVTSPPYIFNQPPKDEVIFQIESNGETYNSFYLLECEATGEPVPKYYWTKDGKNFTWQTNDRITQHPGRGTLSISKPSDIDSGQYQCFAENQYGIATSNSVFFRKAELNSFKTKQPILLTGIEGEPFKLTCQPPGGLPKPIVRWIYFYSNGIFKTINSPRTTLDPDGNLWFSNLTKADTSDIFFYACAVTSPIKFEYTYGNRVFLNVIPSGASVAQNKYSPVLQYATRRNEVAYRGKRAELFCIFGGTPLPQTTWSKNGKIIKFSDRILEGNYGKSLIIKSVDFEDEGTYTCNVSNGVGKLKSHSIMLKILAAPYFIKEPKYIIASENEAAEFNCEAGGVPEPDIHWIYNGKPISETPSNPRRKIYKNKIVIEALKKKDTGNYGCNATNTLGYIYKDVFVNVVNLPPKILEAPADTMAVFGQDVNIACKVLGAPKPHIKWFQHGMELTGGRYQLQEDGNLLINSVQFNDTGTYRCFAENKFGNTSAAAKLEVKFRTNITDGPEDYEVEAGMSATFRCNAVADESLDLEIFWLKNDQLIEFDGQSSDHSLRIIKTRELDSGTYTCLAKTQLDEASSKTQFTVQDVPNPPRMDGVVCHSKEATINWTPMGDNHAPISHYIIQYNTSFTPEEWKVAFDHVPSVDITYNVPMSPWANYTFRVIAVNKIGPSIPSVHSDVCTTNPDVPHKNPDNVKGEGDKPDNLVIYWTPMPQIEHNAPEVKYRIYWKRDIVGKYFEESIDIFDYKQNKFIIADLPSFQQYRIKVIASNELGEANVAPQEVIGYSGENEPELAPTNFTLLAIRSPTTALLSWEPVPVESINGHFKGYKIKTWSDSSPIPKEVQIQGRISKAFVNKLDPYTKNYAQVYVFNGRYNGPLSTTLSFETPEGVPWQMENLDAVPLGSSAFMLKWDKPGKPNGILTGYNIYYAEVNGIEVDNREISRSPQIRDPSKKTAKLVGLLPGTKYRIYISAITDVGESKRYFIERRTNIGHHLPLPPTFEWRLLRNTLSSTIYIQWLPSTISINKTGSDFYVKYRKRGDINYLGTPHEQNEDFVTVTDLEPGIKYDFIVTSVNGPYATDSEPVEILT